MGGPSSYREGYSPWVVSIPLEKAILFSLGGPSPHREAYSYWAVLICVPSLITLKSTYAVGCCGLGICIDVSKCIIAS